eukprot:s2544_g7.t1
MGVGQAAGQAATAVCQAEQLSKEPDVELVNQLTEEEEESGCELSELLSGSGWAFALTFLFGRALAAVFALGLASALAVLCFARAFAFGAALAGVLPSELSVSCSDPHPVGGGLRSLFRDGGIET